MDCYCLDQPMELLIKTNVDGSKVIKKLSRNETKQMENFKKMSKAERKMFSVKHASCFHRCVPSILKVKMKGCACEDCHIDCEYQVRGIFCLTFKELSGDSPYAPMFFGDDPEKGKVFRPIVKHVCDEKTLK